MGVTASLGRDQPSSIRAKVTRRGRHHEAGALFAVLEDQVARASDSIRGKYTLLGFEVVKLEHGTIESLQEIGVAGCRCRRALGLYDGLNAAIVQFVEVRDPQ